MKTVNRNNFEKLLDSGCLYAALTNGRWWQMRRNGQTKRWKRDATRIRTPFKIGLRECGAIEECFFDSAGNLDSHYFRHVDDVPKDKRP